MTEPILFTLKADRIQPYLLAWLPSEYLSSELVGDASSIYADYIHYAFSDNMLDGKKGDAKKLYASLKAILIKKQDEEKPEIILSADLHEEFIFLLFTGYTLIKHMQRDYKSELKIITSIQQWLHMKIKFKQSPKGLTLYLKEYKKSDKTGAHCNDIEEFETFINNMLRQRLSQLTFDYSYIDLNQIFSKNVTEADLLNISNKLPLHDKHEAATIGIITYQLVRYLNANAEKIMTEAKKQKVFTSYHIRYLIPFYSILGWATFKFDKDKITGKISDTRAINAFRKHLTDLTKD